MPTLFFCLCWRARDRINPVKLRKKEDRNVTGQQKDHRVKVAIAQRQFDPHIHATKMLWVPYEGEFWFWESVVSAQRMLLTFVASLVKPGTAVQTVFCLCCSMVFLRLQNYYNPYIYDKDDVIAEWLSWMLIFFYIQAILYMIGSISGHLLDAFVCTAIGVAVFGTLFLLLYDLKRERDFVRLVRKSVTRNLRVANAKTLFTDVSKAVGVFADDPLPNDDDDDCGDDDVVKEDDELPPPPPPGEEDDDDELPQPPPPPDDDDETSSRKEEGDM